MLFSRAVALSLAESGNDGPSAVRHVRDAINSNDQNLLAKFVKNVRYGSAVDELLETVSSARIVAEWVRVKGRTAEQIASALERTRSSKQVARAVSDRPDLSDDTYRAILAAGGREAAEQVLNHASAGLDILVAAAEIWASAVTFEDVMDQDPGAVLALLARLPRQVAKAAWLANRSALSPWILSRYCLTADQIHSIPVRGSVDKSAKPYVTRMKLMSLVTGFALQPMVTDENLDELCRDAEDDWKAAGQGRQQALLTYGRDARLVQTRKPGQSRLPDLNLEDPWGPGEGPVAAAVAGNLGGLATEISRRFIIPWRYLERCFRALPAGQWARVIAEYSDDVEFQAFLLTTSYRVELSDNAVLEAATYLLDAYATSRVPVPPAAMAVLESQPELAGRFPVMTLTGAGHYSQLGMATLADKISEMCETPEKLALLDAIVAKGQSWSFDGTLDDLVAVFRALDQ